MSQDPFAVDQELQRHRAYLCVVARKHLDRRLWSLIDPSDVVQQTLLDAHRKRDQCRGADLRPWLRVMLMHDLVDAIRKWRRIADHEKPLQQAADQSSGVIHASLAADQSSPSQQAAKHEALQRLVDALAVLPENERAAVELHHLHGWPLKEVAECLHRTVPAIAGLLHRGLNRLREKLEEGE